MLRLRHPPVAVTRRGVAPWLLRCASLGHLPIARALHLAATLLALAHVACGASDDSRSVPSNYALPRTACGALAPGQLDGKTVLCGQLEVPADHDDPSAGTYALHVTHFFPRGGGKAPPVVALLGGPGDSTDANVSAITPSFVDAFGHELVFFDQRGAGYSEPDAFCYEVGASPVGNPAALVSELQSCMARLGAEGVDVSTLDTLQNARDVGLLRLALGFDQVVLFGMSYGTRLALTVLADFPEGVAAVALDGTMPPHVNPTKQLGPAVDAVVSDLVAACATAPACNGAHPDLEQKLSEIAAALPVPLVAGPSGQLTLAAFGLALYTVQGRAAEPLAVVPEFITRVHAGVTQGSL